MGMTMDDFFFMALAAGVGVSMVAGPLGCFVVWRRMSYFGATLSHSALLGVALGLLLGVNPMIGVVATCIVIAAAVFSMERDPRFAADTILGILAHGMLALGLVAIAFLDNVRVDLMGYLFGDILAVSTNDLIWIYGGGAACLLILGMIWRGLLSMSVHDELARVEGVPVSAMRLIFMLMIAFVICIAMKIVGIMLIVSMLIIPPATARRFARTPEQMAFYAVIVGSLSVLGGLAASATIDTPAGPSIVVVAMVSFFATAMPGVARRQA
jgi:zinc transport system permease protein